MQRSLRTLCVLIALAVALPVLALLAFTYMQTRDRIQRDLELVARASVAHSEKLLNRVHGHLRKLVRDGNTTCSEADRKVYGKLIYDNIELRGVGVIDGKNRLFECTDILEYVPPIKMEREQDWLVSGSDEIALVPPRVDLQGQLSIFVNYGHGDGRIMEVAIYPQQFWDFQQSLNLGDGGAVMLLDGKGMALTTLGASNFAIPQENGKRTTGFARYGDVYASSARSTMFPIEAVSIASLDRVMADWRQAMMAFAPLALLFTGLASFGVWRFGMRALPLSDSLRTALRAEDQLYLVYQPIMNIATGQIAAVEVLCRWTHPERGNISPELFVVEAARAGLMPELSAWVFRRMAQEMGPLLQRDSDLRVSMNIGRDDLLVDGLLSKAMQEHRNVLSRLIVEITERESLTEVMPEALEAVMKWRDIGVKIALDDFGTGCCNLGYLRQLPIDIVKIDRMFAAALDDKNYVADAEMFDAMRALLHARRLSIVVEGIERETQHLAVRARNIDLAQGWYYAKGMSVKALEVWMLSHEAQRKPVLSV